jgi:hypothetical protein
MQTDLKIVTELIRSVDDKTLKLCLDTMRTNHYHLILDHYDRLAGSPRATPWN